MLVSLFGGLGDQERTRDVQDNNVKFVCIMSKSLQSLCVGVSASYALVYKNSLFLVYKKNFSCSVKREVENMNLKIRDREITTDY